MNNNDPEKLFDSAYRILQSMWELRLRVKLLRLSVVLFI